MKILLSVLGFFALASIGRAQSATPAPSPQVSVETLVCVRHGEKTATELGQLDIQGLNRSLALPKVLISKYGLPQFIFAPNPAETVGSVCYLRPLATIEPTAIVCGLAVNAEFGFRDIQALEAEVRKPLYQNSLVFIAWEHGMLEKFVRLLVRNLGGDETQVPVWDRGDYDSIYVVKITTRDRISSVTFTRDHEGLNNLGKDFPGPQVPAGLCRPCRDRTTQDSF